MLSTRVALPATVLFFGLAAADPSLAQKRGGDLIVAQYAGANSIDPHFTASYPSRNLLMGIYETLFTVDENANTIPMLVAKSEMASDGLTYRFELRRGVKFHNGKEMTSADVKASLERYKRLSPERISLDPVTAIETPDRYVVVIRLKEPSPSFLDRLASPASPATVIPEEEAAKDLNKTNPISTGPFELAEWLPDSHMKLKRFAGYTPNEASSGRDGFGGKKTVYLDTVTLRLMPEASARVSALEAGQVHLAEDVPVPAAKRLAANPKIKLHRLTDFQMPVIYLNHALAPTDNLKVRQAIQAALDMDEIMAAASDGVYSLNHAWTFPGNAYYADTGKAQYNIRDMKRAKALLAESGYKGEPLIFNNASIAFMNRMGIVTVEELKALGLNIKIQNMDWPTLASLANGDQGWNLATSGFGSQPFLGAYAYQRIFLGEFNLAREKNDADMAAAWQRFNTSLDMAGRKAAWADVQRISYDKVYTIKFGDMGMQHATLANVGGFKAYTGALRFWDVWLE